MWHQLGIYTQEEDEFIAVNYNKIPVGDIARHLGRGIDSIRKRAGKIGATRPLRRWCQEEDDLIVQTWKSKGTMASVARATGRRIPEISIRAKKLGCSPWKDRQRRVAGRPIDGFVEGKPIYTHRRIIEEELGRPLSSEEIVHHIDGDIGNNSRDNLCLLKNRYAHLVAHNSYANLLTELVHRGYVRFNTDTGVYEICETDK